MYIKHGLNTYLGSTVKSNTARKRSAYKNGWSEVYRNSSEISHALQPGNNGAEE